MALDDMNATCAWVDEHLDAFLDGEAGGLDVREREAVRRHIASCAACRELAADAERTIAGLRSLPVFDVPGAVVERAARAAGALDTPRRVRIGSPRLASIARWVPAAAAAAALIAVIATAHWSQTPVSEPSPAERAAVADAARETLLALSYVQRYAHYTSHVIEDRVFEQGVIAPMERALDASQQRIIDNGVVPVRRAMKKSGMIETKSSPERS